ncbi:MAG: hypothetical protein IKP46_04155 [Bacteroidales bacterium]|nr:hypothetical protein [Bacteroidales bacterium]
MKTILTHQSAFYQGPDVLIIDGEKSTFSSTQPQVDALKKLKAVLQPSNHKRIPYLLGKGDSSKSLKVFISEKKEMVISSNFLTLDDKKRRISYNYYSDTIDKPEKVLRVFLDDCRIAEMKPSPEDIDIIRKYLRYYNNRGTTFAILGVTAIAFVVALIKIIF